MELTLRTDYECITLRCRTYIGSNLILFLLNKCSSKKSERKKDTIYF